MLIDKTDGKLDEAKEFAEKVGKLDQLQKQLDYLANYSPHETKCELFSDFAPYSFTFVMHTKNEEGNWVRWFNGGLIFHGPHDDYGSGSAPTFSVALTPADGWRIHT